MSDLLRLIHPPDKIEPPKLTSVMKDYLFAAQDRTRNHCSIEIDPVTHYEREPEYSLTAWFGDVIDMSKLARVFGESNKEAKSYVDRVIWGHKCAFRFETHLDSSNRPALVAALKELRDLIPDLGPPNTTNFNPSLHGPSVDIASMMSGDPLCFREFSETPGPKEFTLVARPLMNYHNETSALELGIALAVATVMLEISGVPTNVYVHTQLQFNRGKPSIQCVAPIKMARRQVSLDRYFTACDSSLPMGVNNAVMIGMESGTTHGWCQPPDSCPFPERFYTLGGVVALQIGAQRLEGNVFIDLMNGVAQTAGIENPFTNDHLTQMLEVFNRHTEKISHETHNPKVLSKGL